MNAELLAEMFHASYEKLAPEFGYRTREASAVPWADVPENNKKLMVAVAGEVLEVLELTSELPDSIERFLLEGERKTGPTP